jgi:hypothetical protein
MPAFRTMIARWLGGRNDDIERLRFERTAHFI